MRWSPSGATPDAASWKAIDTVDTDALADLINKFISDGVNGILTTSLNTRGTINKTKYAVEAGAVARRYDSVLPRSERVPHAAIVIYDNPDDFRIAITPKLWGELSKTPSVIAAKQGSTELFNLIGSIKAVGDLMSILSLDHLMRPCMLSGAAGG